MAKSLKEKVGELNKDLSDKFNLVGSRQHYIVFPQEYEKIILQLETLLGDLFSVHGKAKALTLAASFLISEITNSKEFEEEVEADKAEKDGKE